MNPIVFEIFGYSLRYYGLMYAMGLLAVFYLGKRDLRLRGLNLNEDQYFDLILWGFLSGWMGGRLYYVAFNFDYYFSGKVPWYEFLAIWHGGLAIHGALILGPLTLWFYCRKQRISILPVLDLLAVHFLLAQALGRIGNFMNGDAHGVPTHEPWGIVFPYGPAAHEFPGLPTHPVMLYEGALNLLGWFLLYSLRKQPFRPGFFACFYVLLYAAIRSSVTGFRADDLMLMGLRAPYLISLLGGGTALAFIFIYRLYRRQS